MPRWCGSGLVAALLLAAPAMAQESPGAVHAACGTYLVPAFSKPSKAAPKGVKIDCGCVSGYLVGRFGAPDAEVIVRFFATAAGQSEKDMEALLKEVGSDRMRGIVAKVGKFQDLGRQMNEVCPETKIL